MFVQFCHSTVAPNDDPWMKNEKRKKKKNPAPREGEEKRRRDNRDVKFEISFHGRTVTVLEFV